MKKIAVTLIFIISTVLFGIDAGINASAEETEVLEAQAKEAILQNEIATINTELESKHMDVVSELNDQIAYYEKKNDEMVVHTVYHDTFEYRDNQYKLLQVKINEGDRIRIEKYDD